MLVCGALFAQTPSSSEISGYINDAYRWGQDFSYGSARSMGMGGAFTALGGDLGGVASNPAGAVVAPYSQVILTMGASISMNTAYGEKTAGGETYLGNTVNTNNALFIVPNGGFSFNFDTGNYKGLKRVSFGFVTNTKNFFNSFTNASGSPEKTSTYAGSLAAYASSIPQDNWDGFTKMAYKTDLIMTHDALPSGKFMGVTEWPLQDGTVVTDNYLNQNFSQKMTGNKTDYIINVGFNISDYVFLGFNVGMQALNYYEDDTFRESAAQDCDFNTGFSNLNKSHSYRCSGFGVYGKFGVIATPIAGLRVGAAFQTPTKFTMNEGYSYTLYNSVQGKSLSNSDSKYDIRYDVKTPLRFNVGAAYTFKKFAILSLEYEFCDYSMTQYVARYTSDISWFEPVNEQIAQKGQQGSDCLGISNIIRVGAEFKVTPEFAIRGGYNYISSGQGTLESYRKMISSGANYQAAMLGFGYDSPKAFFFDLAAMLTFRPDAIFTPYADYTNRAPSGMEQTWSYGPIIRSCSNLLDIVFTAGWRF